MSQIQLAGTVLNTTGPNSKTGEVLKYHAICMSVAFIGIFPIGSFFTRYFKAIFKQEKSYWELPLWLWIHVIMEGVGIAVMMKGLEYISELKLINKNSKFHHQPLLHSRLGLAICAIHLSFFIFFLIFRTKISKPFRWELKLIIHQGVGHLISVNTLILLNNIEHVAFSGLTCILIIIIRAWTVFFVIMHIIMSMYFSWIENFAKFFKKKAKVTNEITPINMLLHANFTTTNQPFPKFRVCLLILFISVSVCACLSIIKGLDNSISRHYCQDKWYSFLI